MVRINYDGHNGYPYVPVGRILIERNIIPRDEMSMQRIREWMRDNPQSAEEVRRQNRSFVFFRIVGLSDGSDEREAVGAQGVPLTAERSIAVDRALHVYGTPFFIQAGLPVVGEKRTTSFTRLMIAQDTGSAIVGPARADIYLGSRRAGRPARRPAPSSRAASRCWSRASSIPSPQGRRCRFRRKIRGGARRKREQEPLAPAQTCRAHETAVGGAPCVRRGRECFQSDPGRAARADQCGERAAEPAGASALSRPQRHDQRVQGSHRRASVPDRTAEQVWNSPGLFRCRQRAAARRVCKSLRHHAGAARQCAELAHAVS